MVALVVGASRRDQILAAVLEVVRSEGWTEISMRRVADQTGITATALYRQDPEAFAGFYRRAFWIMLAGVGNQ